MNPTLWQSVTGIVTLAGAFCTLYLWVTKRVIREELQRFMDAFMADKYEPLRQDIEVLRIATFNHLSHGQTPSEPDIRRTLGFPERKRMDSYASRH